MEYQYQGIELTIKLISFMLMGIAELYLVIFSQSERLKALIWFANYFTVSLMVIWFICVVSLSSGSYRKYY